MSDIVVSNLPVLVDIASVGVQGAQGLQGIQGPLGPVGPQGPQGLPGAAVGIGEAPTDGTIYGRKGNTATWLNVLPMTGGTGVGATTFAGLTTHAAGLTVSGGTLLAGTITSTAGVQGQLGLTAGSGAATTGGVLSINAAVGNLRRISLLTANSERWRFGADTTAESGTTGSYVGSNLFLNAYDNTGATPVSALSINRSTLQTTLQLAQIGRTFAYTGQAASNTMVPLFLTGSYSGSTDHAAWVGLNNVNINSDVLDVGSANQAIGLYWNQNFGGTGITGGRTGARFQLTQTGPAPAHGNYQAGLFSTNIPYPSGGTDLWGNSAGTGYGGAAYVVINSGATNMRGASGLEIDYGIYSGGSSASLSGLTAIRWASHAFSPPVWEMDRGVGIGSGGQINAAKFGFMAGMNDGYWPVDATNGRIFGAGFTVNYFSANPMQAAHGVDFYNVNLTGTQFRGRGFSVLGSGGALPAGAVQVGGGYLSASGATIALDAAGSTCTGATIATGGANLIVGSALVHDATGTLAWVSAATGGVATAITLVANTGFALAAAIPANPVTFRATTSSALAMPGPPTSPTLNLTWTAASTLALQPSGGTTTFGGTVTLPPGTALPGGPFLPLIGGTVTGAGTALTVTNNAQVFGTLFASGAGNGLTVTNNVQVSGSQINVGSAASTNNITLQMQTTAGHNRFTTAYSGSSRRWDVGADNIAESGGNLGSQWVMNAYNDGGTLAAQMLIARRGSGSSGTGAPFFSQLAPFQSFTPRATIPGGVIGNDCQYVPGDVQPTSTLGANPITTVATSRTVTINWPGSSALNGPLNASVDCWVNIGGATGVGGLVINGWYRTTIVDTDHFTIQAAAPAATSATSGGSAVTVTPSFFTIADRHFATVTTGGTGFPVQFEEFFAANPSFYQGGIGGAGPQYQQRFRMVFSPPDPSGTNVWGMVGEEMDICNRGSDSGYAANLGSVLNVVMGHWIGAWGGVPSFIPGGGTPNHINAAYAVYAVQSVGTYMAFTNQPNSLVGAAQDVSGHGGVGFTSFGAYQTVATNGFATHVGTSTVTITLGNQKSISLQVAGNSVWIPTVTTLNGVTFGGASYVIANLTVNSFDITGTGSASATGQGGLTQWISFATQEPYAPIEFQGSFKHGISTTNFRSVDGSIIHTQPGNGITWDDGVGTASITGAVVSPGTLAVTTTGRVRFTGLPTASTGLVSGTVWNNGGTLCIA